MNIADVEQQELEWLTCKNPDAMAFLRAWRQYVHQIDDLIDGDIAGPEAMLQTFMLAPFRLHKSIFPIQSGAALSGRRQLHERIRRFGRVGER